MAPARADAQLRPVRPLEWTVFDPGYHAAFRVGASLLQHQRASLAGTQGRLLEIGDFSAVIRTGRVALELSGTAARIFEDQSRWSDTAGGARPSFGRRSDVGDLTVTSAVRLNPVTWPARVVIRFGARLPTTNHLEGLDRGEADFIGTLGVALERGCLSGAAEGGIGIFGTRTPEFEQEDDLVYAGRLACDLGPVQPVAEFLGQSSPLRYRHPRGNEDLRELRLGLRAGHHHWIQAQWVHGFVPFSPRTGLLISAGILLPERARN